MVIVPIGLKLSTDHYPKTHEEEEYMSHVRYASAVEILIYARVYTQPKITHGVGFFSRYMSKSGKNHWKTIKRVFMFLRCTISYGL
jgi:hypothetical protein